MTSKPLGWLWGLTATVLNLAEGAAVPPPDELPAPPPAFLGGLQKGTPIFGIQLGESETGVLIQFVHPHSPAEINGLKAQDIILELNGEESFQGKLAEQIRSRPYGEVVILKVKRGDKMLRGCVTIRGNGMMLTEERTHPNAAPVFGLVTGSLSWPIQPSLVTGKPTLLIGWRGPEGEAQGLAWFKHLSPLASSSLAVVKWNGKLREQDAPYDEDKLGLFLPTQAWCCLLDGSGVVKGFLIYSEREFMDNLGQQVFGQGHWLQQLDRDWLARQGLEMEQAAGGLRVVKAADIVRDGLQMDDVILRVEGTQVKSIVEMIYELKAYVPGASLTIEVLRGGRPTRVKLLTK